MLTLRLFDNDYNGSPLTLYADSSTEPRDFSDLSDSEKSAVRNALSIISDIPISNLEKDGAIIFPDRSAKSDLNGGKTVLSVQNLMGENPVIKTTNVLGFFTVGKVLNIEIRSRFDKSDAQFFLHYMLQKACNAAPTVERTRTSKNPLYSFAVYLFPTFLRRAMAQGAFKTYMSRAYNDSHIRGAIDFPRHFRSNIPFNGKIAYRTREFSQNNPLTHVIRHTIEHIIERHGTGNLLSTVRTEVGEIRSCTENYRRQERNIVIAKTAKPIANAFYTEYEVLRKLCRIILLGEKNAYSTSSRSLLNGILFDGASLWEEYLNVVLREQIQKNRQPVALEHPNNRTGEGRKYLFESEHGQKSVAIYPDFLLKSADKTNRYIAILDAKYKRLENGNVTNEDYFQVLTYIFRFRCNRGILIYPHSQSEKKSDLSLKLAGHENDEVYFHAYGLPIAQYKQDERYADFSGRMKAAEEHALQKLFAFIARVGQCRLCDADRPVVLPED